MQIILGLLCFLFLASPALADATITGQGSITGGGTISLSLPPGSAFGVDQSTARQGAAVSTVYATTFTAGTQAGDMIAFCYVDGGGALPTVTDSKGNSYINRFYYSPNEGVGCFVSTNSIGGVTWIQGKWASGDFISGGAIAFTGVTGSTGNPVSLGATLNLSHVTTATATVSGVNTLFIGFWAADTSGADVNWSVGNGYTLIGQFGVGTGGKKQFIFEYQVNTVNKPADANSTLGAGTSRGALMPWPI